MGKLAQENREVVARFDIVFCPVVNLSSLYSKESRNVSANGEFSFSDAALLAVKCRLQIEKLLPVRAERLFEPDGHVGRQR